MGVNGRRDWVGPWKLVLSQNSKHGLWCRWFRRTDGKLDFLVANDMVLG